MLQLCLRIDHPSAAPGCSCLHLATFWLILASPAVVHAPSHALPAGLPCAPATRTHTHTNHPAPPSPVYKKIRPMLSGRLCRNHCLRRRCSLWSSKACLQDNSGQTVRSSLPTRVCFGADLRGRRALPTSQATSYVAFWPPLAARLHLAALWLLSGCSWLHWAAAHANAQKENLPCAPATHKHLTLRV